MKHIIFRDKNYLLNNPYKIALLIKEAALHKKFIEDNYLSTLSLNNDDIIAFSLKYNIQNKAPAKLIKEYLNNLLQSIKHLEINILYVCDSNYFKTLTKVRKVEPYYGYILNCKIKGYEHLKIILGVNYQRLFYDPKLKNKINLSLSTLRKYQQGTYVSLGDSIIHSEAFPSTVDEVSLTLASLHQYPALTVDIETFSLEFNKAGIATIAFAWDKHNGVAFACDYKELSSVAKSYSTGNYDIFVINIKIRNLLLNFFNTYKGKLIYHNANYDIKIIIFELYMKAELLNQQGLINGLEALTKNIDDTKIITYLATNSTSGNNLSLKENAHEFAGNYAKDDINDIKKIPLHELLKYNLIDCLSTWYVRDKNLPIMIKDKQEYVYNKILIPSIKVILQMELSGMPMNMNKIFIAENKLSNIKTTQEVILHNSKLIKDYNLFLQKDAFIKENLLLKVKVKPFESFKNIVFNPKSTLQTRRLLYAFLKLPEIDKTDTGEAAVGNKTLKKLLNTTTDKKKLDIINALIHLSETNIILNTFIEAFKYKTIFKDDGLWYLHGNFNIGGALSGRLSSCLPKGIMVQSKEGLVDIINITLGTEVLTHKGNWKPVVGVVDSGMAKVYKITLCNGKSITCTGNHRLLTTQGFLSLDSLYGKNNYGIARKSSLYSKGVKLIRRWFS